MTQILPHIRCDDCGTETDYQEEGLEEVRDMATADGWHIGKNDLCPDCNKET